MAQPQEDNPQIIEFVTLGMFIIDEIHPPPSAEDQTPRTNIIGGAGTFSAVGARLFSPPPTQSQAVGWIVDAGNDFPTEILSTIESWQTSAVIRPRDGPTTHGWNGYGGDDFRSFRYLTPKKRLTADDLTPELLRSKSIHMICSPTRCVEMVQQILDRRTEVFGQHEPRPIIIWEPVPDLCTPEEFEGTLKALQSVDVISPNHDELGALFAYQHTSGVHRHTVEEQAQRLLSHGVGPKGAGAVIVRCGKEGCYVASTKTTRWLPAYHQSSAKVVDPTGGGNGYLGGFAIGLVRTGDLVEAARMGSVAASFCIEQLGVPSTTSADGSQEAWNGALVSERLATFRSRTT